MSLLSGQKKKLTNYQSNKKKRNSLQTHIIQFTPMNGLRNVFRVRMSLFASIKGSMTLEASLILPIFLFIMFTFMLFIEVLCIQIQIGFTIGQISKELSKYVYAIEKMEGQDEIQKSSFDNIPSNLLTTIYVKSRLEGDIGKNHLDDSCIKNGSEGIHYFLSDFSGEEEIMDLIVNYEIEFPFPFFKIPTLSIIQRGRTKGWTGYQVTGGKLSNEEMVYITTTGTVYHKSINCTHLNLSIRSVNISEIEILRNEQMGKYHICEACGKMENASGIVYVTDYGNRYHNTLSCSGLKRGIREIPISEVLGRNPCSRCGG